MKVCQRASFYVTVISILCMASQSAAVAVGPDAPTQVKACEIVSGEEVAGIANGMLLVNPLPTAMVCNYVVELEGGAAESYSLSFDEAASAELMMQYLSTEEKGEKIAGILDEAYLGKEVMGSRLSLRALRKGKISMTVTGDRREVVLKIAQLAIARLP